MAVHGFELWKSDGTESGTVHGQGYPWRYTVARIPSTSRTWAEHCTLPRMMAIRAIELWKSDGTESGTVRVKDITAQAARLRPDLTNVGGTLYFSAQ